MLRYATHAYISGVYITSYVQSSARYFSAFLQCSLMRLLSRLLARDYIILTTVNARISAQHQIIAALRISALLRLKIWSKRTPPPHPTPSPPRKDEVQSVSTI